MFDVTATKNVVSLSNVCRMTCLRAYCMKSTTWRVWYSRPTHDVFQHYFLILRDENEIIQVPKMENIHCWNYLISFNLKKWFNWFLCNFCYTIRRCVDKIHDFNVSIVPNAAIVLKAMKTLVVSFQNNVKSKHRWIYTNKWGEWVSVKWTYSFGYVECVLFFAQWERWDDAQCA